MSNVYPKKFSCEMFDHSGHSKLFGSPNTNDLFNDIVGIFEQDLSIDYKIVIKSQSGTMDSTFDYMDFNMFDALCEDSDAFRMYLRAFG